MREVVPPRGSSAGRWAIEKNNCVGQTLASSILKEDPMYSTRMIPVIMVGLFFLTACVSSTPAAPGGLAPTIAPALQPTTNPATEAPVIEPTPAPEGSQKYWNTFEDVSDPAAGGITADLGPSSEVTNAKVNITQENVDYAGGKQALAVSGTFPGAQYSFLAADFSVKKLIGEDTLDYSNKTIGFSFFIPKGSPPVSINILLGKGKKYVQLVSVQVSDPLPAPGSLSQGVWADYQAYAKKAYEEKSWSWTNGSEADAMDVIEHCERFWIGISRSTAGTAAETKFYLDDLNWIGIDIFNVPVDNNVDSLRKYAANRQFKFGFFGNNGNSLAMNDPWYSYMYVQEGAVNVMPHYFYPKENEDYSNFDYDRPEDAQTIRQFKIGEGNHMAFFGYGIGAMSGKGNPEQTWLTPQWIQALSFPDATKALLLYHTEKDVRYTKGKNPIWLLFNEYSQPYGGGLRNRQAPVSSEYSPWAANKADSSLIKAAFTKAREVDPGATLMLNDGFDNEVMGWSLADFEYDFISGLKDEGVPIDGVGFEMHNYIDPGGKLACFVKLLPWAYGNNVFMDLDTYLKNVDSNVKRYARKGLKVAFTEVEYQIKIDDINLNTPAGRAEYDKRLQWQAKYYAGVLLIALENENVIMFHTWGITDRYQNYSPWPGFGNGFIFDKHYYPKPAYYAMLDELKKP
jgi:GH35 family endo-1,4-beta-xylanase